MNSGNTFMKPMELVSFMLLAALILVVFPLAMDVFRLNLVGKYLTYAFVALGLVLVLLVSGVIEGFVTPSGLPTWARITIGALAELAFLAYVFILGRRAARAGVTGDIGAAEAGDYAPVSA